MGIVATDEAGSLIVIHAGGDPISREGRVQRAALASFLERATVSALYRPALAEPQIAGALEFARRAADLGSPFDSDFSLETADRLYCTELIWRALSAGLGRDAVPEKSTRSGRVYVALDDLQRSPALTLAWRSASAPAEKQRGWNQRE